MKTIKIVNLISTGLLSLLMLFSAGMYVFSHGDVEMAFGNLGFPTFIIYPLATLKLAGIIVIWVNKNKTLKEWAYAGFFFNLILALSAHLAAQDGEFGGALMGLVFMLASYFTWKKLEK